jgi:hypothetical protein
MASGWWKRLFADMPLPTADPVPGSAPSLPANEDLGKVADEAHFHYEYQVIHNQRVASGRIIHIWYQIAFASSPLIFSSILSLARDGSGTFRDGGIMVLAIVAGAAPPFFSLFYVWSFIDRTIRGYYPRLLALELMLGFQFWRETLKAHQGEEKAYVEECERARQVAVSASEFWERVRKIRMARFSPLKRGHLAPLVAAGGLTILYVVIVLYLWPGNGLWQRICK